MLWQAQAQELAWLQSPDNMVGASIPPFAFPGAGILGPVSWVTIPGGAENSAGKRAWVEISMAVLLQQRLQLRPSGLDRDQWNTDHQSHTE